MGRFNPYEQYNSINFGTANPGTLIVAAYDAAIRALKEAGRSIREGDFRNRTKNFDLAFELVSELRKSLNPEKGGEIAAGLESLYGFFSREILMSNATNDANRLDPVIRMLSDLRGAWDQVRRENAAAQA